jgi:hypothetical protein
MATKYYSVPKWLQEAKPTKVTHGNANPMPSTKAPVSYSERKLPTPMEGTINRNSGATTKLSADKFKLPTFKKATVPDAKLSLKSVDDKFEGKTSVDKLNNSLNKMVEPIANTFVGKIATRGQDTVYNIWDKQSGVDKLGKTGRGDNKAGYITDTGSGVGNTLGDIVGFGSSMIANTGGGTMQGALNPIGKLAESGTAKGLAKLSPSLPSAVNKVANYALPTLAREGAEGAVFGGTLGVDDGVEGVAKEAVKGGVENAVFGMGLKGAGDVFRAAKQWQAFLNIV